MKFLTFFMLLASIFGAKWDGGIYAPGNQPAVVVPMTKGGAWPACMTADGCVLDCGVTGGVWACTDGAGAAVAVTAGAGTVFENSGLGDWQAARIGSDAAAPRLTSHAAYDNVYTSDHTLVVVGASNPSGSGGSFSHGVPNADGLYTVDTTTAHNCVWSGAGANISQGISIATAGRYTVTTCRKNGTSYTARFNGGNGTSVNALALVPPATRQMYFGRQDGAGSPYLGPLGRVRLYSRALSDTELARLEATAAGTVAQDRNVVVDRNSTALCEGSDGFYYAVGDDFGCAGLKGLQVEEARTNSLLRSNELENASWADVLTPTVTANSTTGPFARVVSGVAEAETIDDNDGAGFEGRAQVVASPAQADWTFSCLVKAGTQNDVRLVHTIAGSTGTGNCDYTDVDLGSTCAVGGAATACNAKPFTANGWRRISCTTPVGAVATSDTVSVLVGDAVADQGTIFVVGCQLEQGSFATSPIVTVGVPLQRVATVPQITTVGWPAMSGQVSFTAQLEGVISGQIVFLDTRTGGVQGQAIYNPASSSFGSFSCGEGACGNIAFTQGVTASFTSYSYVYRWDGGANVASGYRDGTLLGTSVANPRAADGQDTTAFIGVIDGGGSSFMNGWIKDIQVRP